MLLQDQDSSFRALSAAQRCAIVMLSDAMLVRLSSKLECPDLALAKAGIDDALVHCLRFSSEEPSLLEAVTEAFLPELEEKCNAQLSRLRGKELDLLEHLVQACLNVSLAPPPSAT